MENMTDVLTLAGQVGRCPDCGDERLLVPVDSDVTAGADPSYCCTTCDAAVLVLDELAVAGGVGSLPHRLAG